MEDVNVFRIIIATANTVLMIVTIILQSVTFEVVRHSIMCSSILILIIVTIVCSYKLRDFKSIGINAFVFILWIGNLIMHWHL